MRQRRLLGALLVCAPMVSGCMDTGNSDGSFLNRFASKEDVKTEQPQARTSDVQGEPSQVIATLQTRQSVLPSGSYSTIATNVLAANARVAEAELRAARLRAEAQSKNWLPSIGPSISLSSLGDLVANLILEQVIFDNGRKKAERDFAKADVEVAAVALSVDTNERVNDALSLYLTAEEGRQIARHSDQALEDMKQFKWIMNERVKGGVSDMSDLNILNQKLSEIQSDLHRGHEKSSAAMAELNAMSVLPLSDLTGIGHVDVSVTSAEPLSVLKALAEQDRDIAQATIERASNLPGLVATASGGTSGSTAGLSVTSDSLFNLGTGATLKAIEAAKEASSRKVSQAQEEANRKLKSLEQQLIAARRASEESKQLTHQAKKNLDLFQAQYEAGQRQVMDVVGVYETFSRQQRSRIEHTYTAARLELAIARELGLLADGDEI